RRQTRIEGMVFRHRLRHGNDRTTRRDQLVTPWGIGEADRNPAPSPAGRSNPTRESWICRTARHRHHARPAQPPRPPRARRRPAPPVTRDSCPVTQTSPYVTRHPHLFTNATKIAARQTSAPDRDGTVTKVAHGGPSGGGSAELCGLTPGRICARRPRR